MKMFKQVSVLLIALLGFSVWIGISFWPLTIFSFFDITVNSILSINTLKSDIGGAFLSLGVFSILYFKRKEKFWLLPLIVVLACILLSRIISSIIDGFSMISIGALLLEAFAILIFSYFYRSEK